MFAVVVRFAIDPVPLRPPAADEIKAAARPGDHVEHVTVLGATAVFYVRAEDPARAEAQVRSLCERGGWPLTECVNEPLEG